VSERTAIGWTEATWNPITGCSRVSPGCEHCYAETLSLRMGWSTKPWTAQNAAENVRLHPERLEQPRRWRSPRRIFVNSMSDLFHERVPDDFIEDVFFVMASAPRHQFQVLTKRPERMQAFIGERLLNEAPLPNVWLGVSCEDQRRADERLPVLLETPAAVRFASFEPLLGPIHFPLPCRESRFWTRLHWAIIGGESGSQYRPMDPAWAESIASYFGQTPLYVKQDSGRRPGKQGRLSDALWARKEYPVRP
jgi:protein gp37